MRLAPALFAAALLLGYSMVSANGRATLIVTEEIGPYILDVSLLPSAAVVSNTHMSILVRSAADDQILTEAEVSVSATGPSLSTALESLPALNDVTPQFYETSLPFDMEGDWDVMVRVESELGKETLLIPMYVHPGGSNVNWILLATVSVLILTAGVWTWDRVAGRKRQKGKA